MWVAWLLGQQPGLCQYIEMYSFAQPIASQLQMTRNCFLFSFFYPKEMAYPGNTRVGVYRYLLKWIGHLPWPPATVLVERMTSCTGDDCTYRPINLSAATRNWLNVSRRLASILRKRFSSIVRKRFSHSVWLFCLGILLLVNVGADLIISGLGPLGFWVPRFRKKWVTNWVLVEH